MRLNGLMLECCVTFFMAVATLKCFAQVPVKPNIIVILTDDMGYADMGMQGSLSDIRTPNLDALGKAGVLITNGYVTAPQCQPSRAGLITGRYQTRFNMEVNGDGPLRQSEVTIAERLKEAGYTTGMAGKWHLEVGRRKKDLASYRTDIPIEKNGFAADQTLNPNEFMPWAQGFDEYFTGAMRHYYASHMPDGTMLDLAPKRVDDSRFRIDIQSEWAVSFVERNAGRPFFLYLSFFAPHVPLEAPSKYLGRFPHSSGKRQMALAMLSAVDDGVGRLVAKLEEKGISENTLIIFLSDNGAPLRDKAWNGSLNTPLIGEKGMLTEGGIRVPFIVHWKSLLPAGKVFHEPVISLDIVATASTIAGLACDKLLDGVNLIPYLLGENKEAPHEVLFWRWRSQAAVRMGRWKLIKLGSEKTFLFDLYSKEGENRNLIGEKPEVAAEMEEKLAVWAEGMKPNGLPSGPPLRSDADFYNGHLKQ